MEFSAALRDTQSCMIFIYISKIFLEILIYFLNIEAIHKLLYNKLWVRCQLCTFLLQFDTYSPIESFLILIMFSYTFNILTFNGIKVVKDVW